MKTAKPSLLTAVAMVVAGFTVFGVGVVPAYAGFTAQGKADICPQCNQDGTWSVPSGPSGSGGTPGTSAVPSGPTPQQREAERRRVQRQRMNETNDKGLRFYEQGDYELAIQALREALALCTREGDCEIIRRSIQGTQEKIERKRAEAQRQRDLEASKQAIGGMLNDLASTWGATPPAGSGGAGGLGFMSSDDNTAINAGDPDGTTGSLEFMGTGQPLFSKGTKDSAPPLAFYDPKHQTLAGEPLKDSVAPVRKRQLAAVDVNRLAARVKAQASSGKANPRTEVFLSALEVGKGDWAESYRHLQDARKRFPDNLAIRDAKNFFEGLTHRLDEVLPLAMEDMYREAMGVDPTKDRDQRRAESDYETWDLVKRAQAQVVDEAAGAREYEVALKLLERAQARHADNLWLRDLSNYFEGSLYSLQMGLTTAADQ